MRVVRSLDALGPSLRRSVLTIGNFDGVHRAHQRIIRRVLARARALRTLPAAMTFDPHPAKIISPENAPPLLTTREQKLELLAASGLSATLVVPFTHALARLSPRDFVEEILCRRLRVQFVCVGKNFRFGHRQAGGAEDLKRLGREYGFGVQVVPAVVIRGRTVSSTLIRRLVEQGRVDDAALLLGRPYALRGSIRKGFQRGQQLGFPTLNLQPEQECLPARGVYVTETLVGRHAYPSATSVGVNPTFGGRRLVVETHLLNFRRRISAQCLEIRFLQRLRSEKKFASPEALVRQMRRDVEDVHGYFRQRRRPAAASLPRRSPG